DAGGLRRDFPRQVVDRGAQAAVDDDRVRALPRQPKRPQQALPIVTDRRFPPDREPDVLELLTDVAEVGVDDLPRQDLVTRADDLDAHHWDRIIHSRVLLRPMSATEAQSPLDAAQKLAPQIRSCADEIEAARELPRPLFEALADAGLFHLALPRALGCPELDLPTYIQVIEELGKADASTAWTVNQGAIFATYAARMPRHVARSIWIDTPRSVVANSPAPSATAVVVPGGYRVTGRQGFSTGCRHAAWVAAHAQVVENGRLRLEADGQPERRYFFVPVAEADVPGGHRPRRSPPPRRPGAPDRDGPRGLGRRERHERDQPGPARGPASGHDARDSAGGPGRRHCLQRRRRDRGLRESSTPAPF